MLLSSYFDIERVKLVHIHIPPTHYYIFPLATAGWSTVEGIIRVLCAYYLWQELQLLQQLQSTIIVPQGYCNLQ